MPTDIIPELLARVDEERLRRGILHLSKDPLPYRKLNHTLPGHGKCTLYEADDYVQSCLESWSYQVETEGVEVQAYRSDPSKPKAHQYSPPAPDDPWYTAYNLYARKVGIGRPDETVVVLAHKDSQSWVDSPGAYDNAVGTAAVLEIARILSAIETRRSVWFLFCNEEHTPWTSAVAAERAKALGDDLVAIINLDGLGGKSSEDTAAGRKTNVTRYVTPEGARLADLMAEVNAAYRIGLEQRACPQEAPGDDDGSFVKAGFPAAIANIGSLPYADPNYHLESDVPEQVDIENVRMAVQASLAAVVRLALA